ncbi:MAG: glutamate racemase [Actinobacteria bacterium]|nr:glutamate racemase [Actinomycetota bacterium]
MDNKPIGVFDSGVGGLTVLREIIKEVPNENTVYFGDTERFPYGPKDFRDVRNFVFKASGFLEKKGIKMLVIACNTGSVAALKELKQVFKIPVIGVIEPGARTAVSNTKNKRVGVIATKGTVESGAYEREISRIDPQIKTFSVAAPVLIEYVEKGILTGRSLNKAIKGYLDPLLKHDIDVLVLGCTHFPLIEKQILEVSGNNFKVISSAVETAKDVKKLLIEEDLSAEEGKKANRIFYETAPGGNFFKTGKMFLGREIKEVIRTKLDV